jgi:hypothetical protein
VIGFPSLCDFSFSTPADTSLIMIPSIFSGSSSSSSAPAPSQQPTLTEVQDQMMTDIYSRCDKLTALVKEGQAKLIAAEERTNVINGFLATISFSEAAIAKSADYELTSPWLMEIDAVFSKVKAAAHASLVISPREATSKARLLRDVKSLSKSLDHDIHNYQARFGAIDHISRLPTAFRHLGQHDGDTLESILSPSKRVNIMGNDQPSAKKTKLAK